MAAKPHKKQAVDSSIMQIIDIPVSDIIPYANNSRTHSEHQVTQIAASIKEFGLSREWRFCLENDCYAVDSKGNVFRVCRQQRSKSGNVIRKYETILMKGSTDRYGYLTYRMMVDGQKKHMKGHRLVAGAFFGGQKDLCVNHKNGLKQDNSIKNLEWVTVAQNNEHCIRTGLLDPRKGGMKNRKVHNYDYMSIFIMNKHCGYSRKKLAEINSVSRTTVDIVINRVKRLLGACYA